MTATDQYLAIYLAPFQPFLGRPDVTDLYVNRPGELWIETLGGAVERFDVPAIDEALLMRLVRQIASLTHQGISREHPLLAAVLPDGTRVQAVAPPATRGPLALAMRKHVSAKLTLADYDEQRFFARAGSMPDHAIGELARLYRKQAWSDFLRLAVRTRQTIVVAGGTATGKTTFANALLREVPASERLILIEDTPELVLEQPNAIGLVAVRGMLGEADVSTDDLLTASLRMRPDRIILGEVRGREAFTFLRAINTGHPGSLTTVHADSPERAIEHLALLTLQAGARLRQSDVTSYIASIVDIFVQLSRHGGQRHVSQIRWRHQPGAVTRAAINHVEPSTSAFDESPKLHHDL